MSTLMFILSDVNTDSFNLKGICNNLMKLIISREHLDDNSELKTLVKMWNDSNNIEKSTRNIFNDYMNEVNSLLEDFQNLFEDYKMVLSLIEKNKDYLAIKELIPFTNFKNYNNRLEETNQKIINFQKIKE